MNAADPRFASWFAGQPTEAEATRRHLEKQEIMRRAAQAALDRHAAGQHVDRGYILWATDFVRQNPPLRGPLGTGEPA